MHVLVCLRVYVYVYGVLVCSCKLCVYISVGWGVGENIKGYLWQGNREVLMK
jgi:hypothetical protein